MLSKIDWHYHIIAFLSALLGILIAFQLEDYKDDRQEVEELEIALSAVQKEVQSNLNIYEKNTRLLSDWLEYYYLGTKLDKNGNITLNKDAYLQMIEKSPTRFDGWEIMKEDNDSVLIKVSNFSFDILPETNISTSSWHAAINSGIINRLEHKDLIPLTQVYQWIEKDFGTDELDIFQIAIDNEGEYDDISSMVSIFEKTVRIQSWKYRMITEAYDKIEW